MSYDSGNMSTKTFEILDNCLETEVKVNTVTYHWRVKNFNTFITAGSSISSGNFQIKNEGISLEAYLGLDISKSMKKQDQPEKFISVLLGGHFNYEDNLLGVNVEFSIFNMSKQKYDCTTKAKCDSLLSRWEIEKFISVNDLQTYSKQYLPHNTLTLRVEIKIFSFIEIKKIIPDDSFDSKLDNTSEEKDTSKETDEDKSTKIKTWSSASDFSQMLENPKFSDISLVVDDEIIPAHKVFLAAKSSVFNKMFEENPNEKLFQLKNIDSFVLKDMMQYIYTGKAPNLNETASGLLAAAQEYKLDDLKILTQSKLCSKITKENVGALLLHANIYDAQQLKLQALKFIKKDIKSILNTDGFQSLLEKNPKLMKEIFYEVLK